MEKNHEKLTSIKQEIYKIESTLLKHFSYSDIATMLHFSDSISVLKSLIDDSEKIQSDPLFTFPD